MLWTIGSLGLIGAAGITAYGFTKSCANEGVSCTIDALLMQSLGLLGLFLSSLFIVGGFALRSKARQKLQEARYEEFMKQMEEKKKLSETDES